VKKAQEEEKRKSQMSQKTDPKFLDHSQSRRDTIPAQASENHSEDEYKEDYEPVEETPVEDVEVGAHLKFANDLHGFPVFPTESNSLLKKYLTREVWDELKNAQDEHGFTFQQAIFKGCKNVDASVGVIAGSHDSYRAFASLFDKIIEDYHGHKQEAEHLSDLDSTKLVFDPFTP